MTKTVSEFLESFPIPLHHREPGFDCKLWFFWSQYDGSQNNSSSADRNTRMIYEKIKTAFSMLAAAESEFISQFWVPVTIGGRRLLSTSGQPFAVSELSDHFITQRINSAKYQYIIDENNLDIELDPMILCGGPATSFLSRMPYIDDLVESSLNPANRSISIMLPISSPSGSSCIGVVECTIGEYEPYEFCSSLFDMNRALKEAGLDVFDVQSHIPYKTVHGLKAARDEIAKALEIICGSHNITLAQVWIVYEDKYNVTFLSSLEDSPKKRMLALKLTGYLSTTNSRHYGSSLEQYYNLCDIVPQESGDLALKTLQNYEPHYISTFGLHRLMYDRPWDLGLDNCVNSGLAVCLRSIDTGDFNYAFEFIWRKHSNTTIMMLEALLLTLKRCLPSFKFTSGGELGDELDVIDVKSSNKNETSKFKIFQGMENGKKPSEVKCKTGSILLPREVIEKQFGRTIKDAAKNLNVSESTLKRKFKDLGILEWPGPKLANRKANDSSIIQIDTTRNDSEAIQDQSMVIIKAHGTDDIIKFDIPISQATFENVDKKVRTKFKLAPMTYKIKYRDEFGDWILLISDEDMSCCMESMRKMNRAIVELHVRPSTQPISDPSGSYSTY